MKLSTTQENLSQGLSLVSRITGKNVNLPILQNVLLKSHEKVIKLSTTNLEIAVSCMVRGKVEEDGEFTIPARLFADYISLLPSGRVDLELTGNLIIVKSGQAETKINGIPATEFPVIPRVTQGITYILSVDLLKKALSSVLFAVAQTESRPELMGVYFYFQKTERGGVLTLAATDSYRLGEVLIPVKTAGEINEKKLIIPAKTLNELLHLLSGPRDEVEVVEEVVVTVAENQVQFEIGNAELQSRVIEGVYPDYQQIIPNQFKTEAVLPRSEFISIIKAASLFTKTGLSDVRLEFSPGKPITIHTADTQTGEHKAQVAAEVSGAENFVVVNYRYLLDGLNAINDDEIVFRLIDAANPCVISPKDKQEQYLYIVMPIRQ